MISIIIPAYNEEKYIGTMLSRLKSLKLPHEVIVSDDKSTDRTVEIVRQHVDKVLTTETKHATIAANRNYGAKEAHGEILVFLDVDHYIEDYNEFFTAALKRFETTPDLVALTGIFWVLPDMETWADRVVYAIFNLTHIIKNNLLNAGEAPGKFQMIRKTAFDKVNGFRADLVTREDADMFQRLAKVGKVHCDPKLKIYHSGRRAHAIGWPKLLTIWMVESFKFAFLGKSKIKEWTAVR